MKQFADGRRDFCTVTELGRLSTGKLQFDDNFDIFTLMEPFEGSLMGHFKVI